MSDEKPSNRQARRAAKKRKISVGAIILALLTAGGGWLGWHLKDCLTDQKSQIIATRKAWKNNLTTAQKYTDDLAALSTRSAIYRRERQGRNNEVALEQSWKALFDISQTMLTDCNANKAAQYEFSIEYKKLSQLFAFDDADDRDLSRVCQGIAGISEGFRNADSEPEQERLQLGLDSYIERLEEAIETTGDRWRTRDREKDVQFTALERQSYYRRVMHCLF